MTKIQFSLEDLKIAIKTSKSHSEAKSKLGYNKRYYKTERSLYNNYLKNIQLDTSHFDYQIEDFNDDKFLYIIKISYSHNEAAAKLGYRNRSAYSNGKYRKLFEKLQPDISHFKKLKSKIIDLKAHRRQYEKYRRDNDIQFRLAKNLRSRLKSAIRQNQKAGSAVKDLGCSIEKFKLWIEMHWKDDMTWDNYGKWELDHVKPLSSFDLTKHHECRIACHFTNIMPLWKKDNQRKYNSVQNCV